MTIKYPDKAIFELIKALVPNEAVFMMRAPDNTEPPYIIVQTVDRDRWRDINGPSGVAQASIQVDAYHSGFYDVRELSGQIESVLDGYADTVYYGVDSPQDFVEIGGISLQSDNDLLDEEVEPLYRNSANYLVTYNQ